MVSEDAKKTFLPDKIAIKRKSKSDEIQIKKITEIICMDPKDKRIRIMAMAGSSTAPMVPGAFNAKGG